MQRGKKSEAELAVAPVEIDQARQRPAPPEGFGNRESAIWRRIVAAMPGGWFSPEHRELLARYCEHQIRAERFSAVATRLAMRDDLTRDDIEDIDRACKLAERESRAALALARSMRITHQSQLRAETAARRVADRPTGPAPWESAS